jgi:general secretion pathway protein A
MLRILTNFDMDSRLVLSLVLAGQTPLRALLARDDQEAMARRIIHYAQLRLLSRDELAQYIAHRCAVAGDAYRRRVLARLARERRADPF